MGERKNNWALAIPAPAGSWGLVREKEESGSGSLGSQGLLHLTRFEDLLLIVRLKTNTEAPHCLVKS